MIEKASTRLCWNLDVSGQSPTVTLAKLTIRGDVRIGLNTAAVDVISMAVIKSAESQVK